MVYSGHFCTTNFLNKSEIMENVKEQVRAIVAEKLGVEIEMVVDSANFQGDLGADSLDIVELVMEFESKFGIEIPDDMTGNILLDK